MKQRLDDELAEFAAVCSCGAVALPGGTGLCNACWVRIRDQPLETAANIFRARDRS